MDIAKCVTDGVVYYAEKFSLFEGAELGSKRRNLICTECGADAFFRKESTSGQAACFGARPHVNDCSFASPETQRVELDGGEEDFIRNPGTKIEIDLNYGAAQQNFDIDSEDAEGSNQERGRHSGRGSRPSATMHRRLSTLLKNLINSEDFRESHQAIELAGHEPTLVKDFFVSFDIVGREHSGQFKGYWGLITDARYGLNGSLWLNSGDRSAVSCVISVEAVDGFLKKYKVKSLEEFSGAYMLMLGTKSTSQNGKKFIWAEDEANCTALAF